MGFGVISNSRSREGGKFWTRSEGGGEKISDRRYFLNPWVE